MGVKAPFGVDLVAFPRSRVEGLELRVLLKGLYGLHRGNVGIYRV